ncbi:hypothetical protein AL052_09845 [Pseudomonas amygdali pv. eriobotryae]|nr:hypothetical protein AL052_09845 [Pseudomonas amygdali pv. eriobotryae]
MISGLRSDQELGEALGNHFGIFLKHIQVLLYASRHLGGPALINPVTYFFDRAGDGIGVFVETIKKGN